MAADGWDWPVSAHSCICMRVYVCVNMSNAVPCAPAGNTWLRRHRSLAHAVSVPAGWQRGETRTLQAHPGEEGLPAHLLSHHLGPCVCGCPAPDPLGSTRRRRTSAISNLLVKRENNNQQTKCSCLLQPILTACTSQVFVRTVYLQGAAYQHPSMHRHIILPLFIFYSMSLIMCPVFLFQSNSTRSK